MDYFNEVRYISQKELFIKKNIKVKKTKEEIQAEKEQRWKQMRNLAKTFAKQAGIKVVKEKKTNNYDY